MAPTGNTSMTEEKCFGCKKCIHTGNYVRCAICHKCCHLNCVVPKLSDEVKKSMKKNRLLAFHCPACHALIAKHQGKITDEFIAHAEYNVQINEMNSKQIEDMKKELSSLNKHLQKATTERNAIADQVNSRGKRARNEDSSEENMVVIMGIVKQMIESSNKTMETLIKNSEERNNQQIKLLTAALTSFEERFGNSKNVESTTVTKVVKDVNVPLKKADSELFTEIQFGLNQIGFSLKITFDTTDKKNYDEIIFPAYRNDTVIRTFNLISVAENGNQFVLTFKSKTDRASAIAYMKEKFGDYVKFERPKEFIPMVKIVGLFARDADSSDLQKMIIESNPALQLSNDNFRITQIYNNGIQKGSNAIAQLTLDKFKALMAHGSLLVDTKNCKIYEQLELLHCGKCQKYGHVKKFCKSEEFTCGNCASNHQTTECKDREKLKCINCVNLNNQSIKTNHYTSSPACRVRKERIAGIKKFLKMKLGVIQTATKEVEKADATPVVNS